MLLPALTVMLLMFFAAMLLSRILKSRITLLIRKNGRITLLKNGKKVRVGFFLPLKQGKNMLSYFSNFSILKGRTPLILSLELLFSHGKRDGTLYVYYSPSNPISKFVEAFFSNPYICNTATNAPKLNLFTILEGRSHQFTSSGKHILLVEKGENRFFISLMLLNLASHQKMLNVAEKLASLSKCFEVEIFLISPIVLKKKIGFLKARRVSTYPPHNSFKVLIASYALFISKDLYNLKEALDDAVSSLSPLIQKVTLLNWKQLAKNRLNVLCRLPIKPANFSLVSLSEVDCFISHLTENRSESSYESFFTPHNFFIGELIVKNLRIPLKLDERAFSPALAIFKRKSSLLNFLNRFLPQVAHKWVLLDFIGALSSGDIKDSLLFLSSEKGDIQIDLLYPHSIPFYDHVSMLSTAVFALSGLKPSKDIVFQMLIKDKLEGCPSQSLTLFKIINMALSQNHSKKNPQHPLQHLFSDLKQGALDKIFRKTRLDLRDIIANSNSNVILDLSNLSKIVKPPTLALTLTLFLTFLSRIKCSLIVLLNKSLFNYMTTTGSFTSLLSSFNITLFLFLGIPPSSPVLKDPFKVLIEEQSGEGVLSSSTPSFVLMRMNTAPLTFYLPSSSPFSSPSKSNDQHIMFASALKTKLLQLLERFTYVTEEFLSSQLRVNKGEITSTLNSLKREFPHIRKLYVPLPNGKRTSIFFLKKNEESEREAIKSYVQDLIEQICIDLGLKLAQRKDPKLGIDCFIESYPLNISALKTESELPELLFQINRSLEKYGRIIVLFMDERDAKIASRLRSLFKGNDNLIIGYLHNILCLFRNLR